METYLRIKKDRETGEWLVVWMEGGKRNEDKTYYCDDRDDAVGVALHTMARHPIVQEIRTSDKKCLEIVRAQLNG
jgi:hypothetical protein